MKTNKSRQQDQYGNNLTDSTIFQAYSDKYGRTLQRLHRDAIIDLAILWLDDPRTEPHLEWSEYDFYDEEEEENSIPGEERLDQDENVKKAKGIRILKEEYLNLIPSTTSKKEVLQRILQDHWSKGLNMLQISQIDTKYILETPNTQLWTYSTLIQNQNELVPGSLKRFVKKFQSALYPIILSHISMTRYEPLMLSFVRIQIFEAKSVSALLSSSTVDRYNAAPPIYLSFPDSSPHLIHSYLPPGNVYLKSIFQALSIVFSQPERPLQIKLSSEVPVKSLAAFAALKGANRAAKAQGAWSIYAKGKADLQNNPLKPYTEHKKRDAEEDPEAEIIGNPKRLMSNKSLVKLANERFHGDSEYMEDKEEITECTNVQFSSAEFSIKSRYRGSGRNNEPFIPNITMRLQGSDVFGGIKELALKRIVDITKIPGWLTGENGASSGAIVNGRFHED